jgi:carboxypeptidase family protein
MTMSKRVLACFGFFAVLVLSASPLWAQGGTGSIGGVVRDATGAVLPGVTVEASSPALIERVRTAVSDGEGQYRIVELVPGTYTVTATLTGFSTVKRDGVVLQTGFAANVSLELQVGDVAETITVSGATPIVDVQNVRKTAVISREMLDTLPTGRSFQDASIVVPGMVRNGTDVGGQTGQSFNMMAIHGGRAQEMRIEIDGVGVSCGCAQNAAGNLFAEGNYEEFTYDLSAQSAESETGGVRVNLIPKQGGNSYSGKLFGNWTSKAMAGDNNDDELRAAGLKEPNNVKSLWTINPSLGGPLLKDTLWFFGAYTYLRSDRYISNLYYNLTPTGRAYTPDFSRQAVDDTDAASTAVRLTYQATPRNKFGLFYNYDPICHCHFQIGQAAPGPTPEASSDQHYNSKLWHWSWSAPVSSRLFLESAALYMNGPARYSRQKDALGVRITDVATGYTWGSRVLTNERQRTTSWGYKAAMSYVTGSHALKVGISVRDLDYILDADTTGLNVSYTLSNGTPVAAVYEQTPYSDHGQMWRYGIFARTSGR